MRIELRPWQGNTEVMLVEDEPWGRSVKDSFYTSAMDIEQPVNADAREQFYLLEDKLPPPKIGGQFGHLHPYWEQRRQARMRREGVTQQDIAETMPPRLPEHR
jgi:hypothetical protein